LEDGSEQLELGRLPLFRNFDENGEPYKRPNTLLIDSEQLESGEGLDEAFRKNASDEIERFRRERVERSGDSAQGENITDHDLLREVMNTVGKPGQLGSSIRCVVSVSMLTEGWDANTVTHVLGVRAFGTQLLCEQVIGRALRRLSYDLNEEDLFDVEYADVFGIPFDFTARPVVSPPQKPSQTTQVRAVSPERDFLEIRFPRVIGYRTELPEEKITANFTKDSILELTPDLVGPSETLNSGIIGESENMDVHHMIKDMRKSSLIMYLTKHLLDTQFRKEGQRGDYYMFNQFKGAVREWLDTCLVCKGGTNPAQLMYLQLMNMACERIGAAIVRKYSETYPVNAILDPYNPEGSTIHVRFVKIFSTVSQWAPSFSDCSVYLFCFQNKNYTPTPGKCWITTSEKMALLEKAERLFVEGAFPRFISFHEDFKYQQLTHPWRDTAPAQDKSYIVETNPNVIQRCILMTTDPGDLVLDPTCGSGTTAYVAEQWGRRWITIDTSRVSLALARARVMGARYPYYILKDSPEGPQKEAEITNRAPSTQPVYGNVRHGFVYERVPHITLKSIANNAEIDVIWEKWQKTLEPLRESLNKKLDLEWQEWEIPRDAADSWPAKVKKIHAEWWEARIARQKEIDASIAAHADFEYLYDKPYAENKKIRVAGPFTVESMSPHRMAETDEHGEIIDSRAKINDARADARSFVNMILENLKISGVQQSRKEDKIDFIYLAPWPGVNICAEGRYMEGTAERRAGVFIGPEFGTVRRDDLVAAAREVADAGFDVLIAVAFSYEARVTDFDKLGRIPVLKARMNADLHMSDDLKNTGKGNLFVIFGEPDIDIIDAPDGKIQVRINGVDVFDPNTGEIKSDGPDGIACWFVDTDYNEESFFVRHAYFLGANDPYKALKTTLKAEINEEAWATLHSAVSRPFDKPESGRIAVKVINHLGDEVMKVYRV
jgi:hypothetical protein